MIVTPYVAMCNMNLQKRTFLSPQVVPTTNSRVEMMSDALDLAIIKLNSGDAPPGVRVCLG